MSKKKLKEQCFIMLVMVIIMGGVLLSTYEAPEHIVADDTDVIAGAAVTEVTDTAGKVSGHDDDTEKNEYEGIIRLHVVANSDSEFDQAVKLKVRDEIISVVNDLSGKDGINQSRQWLELQLDDVEKTANGVLAENGCNYRASAELGVRWIPEKTYGDMHFPAGNYEALTVTLGKGEGENWWCVLFPPLCLITEDEAELEELGIESEDQIKVKSWLVEVLGESSNKY